MSGGFGRPEVPAETAAWEALKRPDGTEKLACYGRVPADLREDARAAWLDHEVRARAAEQGAILVKYVSTELHPHRWLLDDDGHHAVAEACSEGDADHHLVVVKWWAIPPADRPSVEMPGIPAGRMAW